MKSLAIDTSNQILTVSLGDDDQIMGSHLLAIKKNHSLSLMPTVDQLMKECGVTPQELGQIVIAKGPGSYTGLRIGVTTAKTLAWTLGIELTAVSSLAVLAGNVTDFPGYIVPIFNARRKNVYTGIYQWRENQLVNVAEDRHTSLADWLQKLKKETEKIIFVGEDCAFFATEFQHLPANIKVCEDSVRNTINGLTLLNLAKQTKKIDKIKEFIPNYLKLVEAEEKWLESHESLEKKYVKKI